MADRVYSETRFTYFEAVVLLEDDGLIEVIAQEEADFVPESEAGGAWGFAVTALGVDLLEAAGYPGRDPSAGAALMWARMAVERGEHASIEDAVRDPWLRRSWESDAVGRTE